MKKRNWKQRLLTVIVSLALIITMMPAAGYSWVEEAEALTSLGYVPYANVEYSYSESVSNGTIRYISQLKNAQYFNWAYWPKSSFGSYGAPGSECGTCCISMALSYLGVNKTPNEILTAHNGKTYFTNWGPETISINPNRINDAMNNYINSYGAYSPVMINVHGGSYNKTYGHWILLAGYKDKGTYVVVDPANENVTPITLFTEGTSVTANYNGKNLVIKKAYQYRIPHIHEFNSYDICTDLNCGTVKPYSIDTSYAGTYQCIADKSISLKKSPYAASVSIGNSCYTKGVKFQDVTGSVINSKGNRWYQVRVGNEIGYVYSENVKKIVTPSNISISMDNVQVSYGKSQNFVGVITSNYRISNVTASMDGNQFTSFSPNSTRVDIKGSPINKFKCATLSPGAHTLTITARDVNGGSVTKNITVNVSGTVSAPVSTPVITYEDIYEGKRVTVSRTAAGGTLFYYYYKCTNGNASTTSDKVTFDVYETSDVAAYSALNGRNSGQAYLSLNIGKLSAPAISVQQKGNSAFVVITNQDTQAEIYYSINGKAYTRYYGAVELKGNATVSAVAKRKGYKSSDTSSTYVVMTAPDTPRVMLANDSNAIAQGSAAAVRWNRDDKAISYTVRLYDVTDGSRKELEKKEGITDTSYGFSLENAGKYQITVEAVNGIGSSQESEAVTIEAKEPVTATFKNDDGTVLNEIKVDYNSVPTQVQKPSKRGYVFIGWKAGEDGAVSLDSYLKTRLTEDISYTAQYQKEVYKVKFLDTDGKTLSTKEVEFDDPANPPEYNDVPEGYKFVGWNIVNTSDNESLCDYNHVDCNMELQAVIAWENSELPAIAKINEAIAKGEEGYSISVSITKWDKEDTDAYIVIALKTKDKTTGAPKTVFVDREKVILTKKAPGENIENYLFNLAYKGNASTVEVMLLECKEDETTGSAYSEVASKDITVNKYWGEWSGWSTEKPQEQAGRAIETKTQYQYRTLQRTSVTNGTISGDGWELYCTDGYWGNWSDFSGWSTNYVQWNDSTDVQRKTQYKYYRCYCNKNYYHDWYGGASCFNCSGKYSTYEYQWFDVPYSQVTTNATGDGKVKRSSMGGSVFWYYYPQYYSTRHGERFVYRYRTRPWNTVNYYWKWNPWSEWSDQIYTASENQEVNTRTLYRYRDEISETADPTMDTAGTVGAFSGQIISDENLTGKVATIMVYQSKNMDANKYQMQYIGQTVIGDGNSYDFSFIPKEEPTTDSGNYVVALGVQGTTGLINVGVVEAPKREYSVRLHYFDNEGNDHELSTQLVKEGEDVDLSNIILPEREGYYFAGWERRTTNIIDECSIQAVYLPVQNTVVYVDWVNESIGFQTALTGAELIPPYNASDDTESTEGYTFKGWDVLLENPSAKVTGNMVLTAQYDIAEYDVEFVNEKNEVISSQTVKYGESAKLPASLSPDGMVFLGWSTEHQWWNVNENMRVEPILIYDKSAMVPIANVESYYEGKELDLELQAEEGTRVYYTTDGSDPADVENENRIEYTEPIHLEESTQVLAAAEAEGKNTSDVIEIVFEYSEEDYYSPYTIWESIGEYNVVAEPDKEIILNLRLDENPGLIGYHFLIQCDRRIFHVDYDEDSSIICEAGAASEGGNLFVSEYEDSGWQILWFAPEESYNNGSLFKLKLKVFEDAESGVYPVKVSYAKANTLTADTLETELSSKKVSLNIETNASLLGDANGDGSVTAMDVVRIARYVVGLTDIPKERIYLADVNRDEKVTIADAILLARNIVGLEKID